MIAVLFKFKFNDNFDRQKYWQYSAELNVLVKTMPGFLRVEDYVCDSKGVSISYWNSMEDVKHWANNPSHKEAIDFGRNFAYKSYSIEYAEIKNHFNLI